MIRLLKLLWLGFVIKRMLKDLERWEREKQRLMEKLGVTEEKLQEEARRQREECEAGE